MHYFVILLMIIPENIFLFVEEQEISFENISEMEEDGRDSN